MKHVFGIILLLITFQVQAQLNSRDSVIGTWICTEVSYLESKEFDTSAMKSQAEQERKAFLNVKFIFNANGIFKIEFPKNTKGAFAEGLAFLNNRKWFFDITQKSISIGTPQENLMRIDLKEDQKNVYFLLYETPLVLKMQQM